MEEKTIIFDHHLKEQNKKLNEIKHELNPVRII
jgi:hypothetical protein